MASIIDQLLEDISRHPEKRKQLARMLALDIATGETLRSLLLEGLLRDVVTKQDLREVEERLQKQIEELREELRKDIWRLDERIDRLNQRIDSLVKWMVGLLASIWLTLVALLLPIILKTLGIMS